MDVSTPFLDVDLQTEDTFWKSYIWSSTIRVQEVLLIVCRLIVYTFG